MSRLNDIKKIMRLEIILVFNPFVSNFEPFPTNCIKGKISPFNATFFCIDENSNSSKPRTYCVYCKKIKEHLKLDQIIKCGTSVRHRFDGGRSFLIHLIELQNAINYTLLKTLSSSVEASISSTLKDNSATSFLSNQSFNSTGMLF